MENKLSTLAKDFSLKNLERYLLDKGFTVDIKPVFDIQDIEEKYKISDIKEIGHIRLKQNTDLVVFAIKIDNLTERTSKKRQFDIAKRLLERYLKFYGLFVFYDDNKNFRLSFVFKTTYGTKATYSHYKRFTFYVSPNLPNKTFINQLKKCDFTDLESIKQAFSTQPITEAFYDDLQNWYYYALDKVKFPDDYKYSDDPEKDREIRNAQGLIRLLTRLIFIWFLKEKGLVPDKLFDEKYLKNIVKDFGKGDNYYNAILQNLFFATLNRPMDDRGWAEDKGFPANKKDFGVKSLYRYENKFLISKEEVLKLFKDIPFINGGLFDCLDKDKVYIDGFSRNEKKQAKISDESFFSDEKTVDLSKYGLSKNAEVRGLINILKSYNFTTDEATPIDQEIALDPELLGKVFENLLASYNPETNTTARKATGSYYTPREIVDYMVEESLREYLKTKVPEAENILDDLFSYSDNELEISDDLRKKLIEAIDQVKIIDPACGSGAFPMGILHKLVFLLQKLDPSNKVWYELQVDRIKKESKEALEIAKDENTLKELLNEVKEHFDESINYPDYARKLYLIENCIYGVDIQPIAIQISKLRFFISLILDQKVDKDNPENFGILPLPNLETKFISANALIGLEKPTQKSLRNPEIKKLEQELKFLRHRYFRIKSRAEKIQLQNKDKELREKLKNALINDGWNDKVAEKIANFDIFDQNASADWFDPEWMFGVVDGFDIVIGNPPYVRQEFIKDKDLIINSISKCFVENDKSLVKINRRSDLYIYFYYKGLSFLKTSGVLCYISSNSWLDVDFGAEFQEFLLKYMHPLMIVDNVAERSFDAGINTVIVLIKRPERINLDDIIKFVVFKKPFDEILNSEILKVVRHTNDKVIAEDFRVIPKTRKELWIEGIEIEDDEIKEKYLWNYKYIGNKWGGKYLRAPEIFFKILEKGKDKLVRLGDIAEVKRGFTTGANEFFYLEPTGKTAPKGLLHVKNSAGWEGYIEEEFLKPVIKSPKELKTIIVREEDLKYRVFMCHKSKNELKGTYALEYIEWGEKQGYHKRPTCASRQRWWDLGKWDHYPILWQVNIRENFIIPFKPKNIESDKMFYLVRSKSRNPRYDLIIGLYLNSTLSRFFLEVNGLVMMGDSTLAIYMVKDLQESLMVKPGIFIENGLQSNFELIMESFTKREILDYFEELGFPKCNKRKCDHPEHPYEYVKPEEVSFDRIMPDRRELDKIVFETLNLTEEEQLEVYKAVIELVRNRLLKAKSK